MQLLFWRMLTTTLICSVYIIWQRIPHGILGDPKVRWLLIARGFTGFFGIYGLWYSIKYLPLAEATIITFLTPNLQGCLCHLLLGRPYTMVEKLASILALGGVVLVAKPESLFSMMDQGEDPGQGALDIIGNIKAIANRESKTPSIVDAYVPTASERLGAVGVALVGVMGAAFAFTSISAIGKRAHTLISVNYFGGFCVLISFIVLSFSSYFNIGQPGLQFTAPASIRQWGLLAVIVACGLASQVFGTMGISADGSNKSMTMLYTSMVFAAGFDYFVWGITIGWVSLAGCAMIIAGAAWVLLSKDETNKATAGQDDRDASIEGIPMLPLRHDHEDDDIV
ncbi:hypothetical protein F5B22DRAFT_600902 [Xylaria bambusicola]|uniref:uncharacterized protein n=1 Tax=Xylaria bambusicola TaxID=326684 RepID=UPI0020082738|nr:uncharacterized protein F5B22DRAFT_600902 [Xylaria bambusicola]KAI0518353.1 hypothetical protein F5B22DRAFT_600902 [Xylaria bambusicola]